MSQNQNDRNKTRFNFSDLQHMNTYPPLPRALTPGSSSTPGPPPFDIIRTPFFEGRAPDYSVHHKTLAHMNRDSQEFDIDDSEREGYMPPSNVYRTYVTSPAQQSRTLSHITIHNSRNTHVTHPQSAVPVKHVNRTSSQNSNRNSNSNSNSKRDKSPMSTPVPKRLAFETPSPSLLQRTDTLPINTSDSLNENSEMTEIPYISPLKQRAQTRQMTPESIVPNMENIEDFGPGRYESSWISDLNVARTRMGLNGLTSIMILAIVMIGVQIRQFHVIREDRSHNSDRTPITINNDQLLRMERHIQTLERRLNDTTDTMHSKTELIEDKLDSTSDRIRQNSETIEQQQREQKEVGLSINQKLSEMDQSISSVQIEGNLNMEMNQDMSDLMEFWRMKSRTNWISEILDKPVSARYGLAEYALTTTRENDLGHDGQGGSDGILAAMRKGAGLWLEEQRRGEIETMDWDDLQDELWRDTANRNIADDATPQTLEPHDCLQFPVDKEQRWIELKLIEKVVPTEFEYIHIAKANLLEKDWNQSPRRFRLFGKVKGGNWTDLEVKKDSMMAVGDDKLALEFVEGQAGIEYLRVEWDVHADAKSTRLYRLRIHGKPDVSRQSE